jgi:AcrR family transcriptional regulator
VIALPKRDRLAERRSATRAEIVEAAWDCAHEHGLAGLTLREIADRVGMQPPSLYSHFSSKQDIYDAMFAQAWDSYYEAIMEVVESLPSDRRELLVASAEHYFDFSVADLARHQLMDIRTVPGYAPSAKAYEASLRVYELGMQYLPLTNQDDRDIYVALISGLVEQQLANDPGGTRWRRLLPRVITMFADDLGLPPSPPHQKRVRS